MIESRQLDSASVAVSRAARGGFAWVAAGAAVAHSHKEWRPAVEVAAATWAAQGAATALSHLIGRERPCRSEPGLIDCPPSPSLPSNHAAAAFGAAVALGKFTPPLLFLLPALAVAASRVRVGVHTHADVAAGAALGAGIGATVRAIAASME
jgi:membrane-associated phospholipid phosphatase